MNYNDKLRLVKEFVEENFDDPVELVIALRLSVEDIITLLPDVLVANYHHFFEEDDNLEEYQTKTQPLDFGSGEGWEDSETGDY
jgi:ABC-type Fe3+-hydroxamate transport system substrate-binding protein